MVDEERVTRLASDVRRDLARLRHVARTEQLVTRVDQLDAVKYRFHRDQGLHRHRSHITASVGWEAPDSNADAMRSLGKHGVISTELAEVMARAAGFRNLLVHRYEFIDDHAVVQFLVHLDQLDQYIGGVLAWLESAGSSRSDR